MSDEQGWSSRVGRPSCPVDDRLHSLSSFAECPSSSSFETTTFRASRNFRLLDVVFDRSGARDGLGKQPVHHSPKKEMGTLLSLKAEVPMSKNVNATMNEMKGQLKVHQKNCYFA